MRDNGMHRGSQQQWLTEYRAGRRFEREFGARADQREARTADEREGRFVEPRSWLNRATDEVAAWFGVHDALRRRQWDEAAGNHEGAGPTVEVTSDERIRAEVGERLAKEGRIDATGVTVAVESGVVDLTGAVRISADRHLAEEIAGAVRGVVHVRNDLTIV
jgi:osmotically-inducible protein OsmY